MNKSFLRDRYKEVRKNISSKEEKSFAICDELLEMVNQYDVIALYASMIDEVKTDSVINRLLNLGKVVCLPKIEGEGIRFYKISSLDELVTNRFGIREPKGGTLIEKIDVVVVPGICFDLYKNRVGFGKAYYDRYLAIHSNVLKVGICFDEQIVDEIDTDEYDQKMDIIITDKRTIL